MKANPIASSITLALGLSLATAAAAQETASSQPEATAPSATESNSAASEGLPTGKDGGEQPEPNRVEPIQSATAEAPAQVGGDAAPAQVGGDATLAASSSELPPQPALAAGKGELQPKDAPSEPSGTQEEGPVDPYPFPAGEGHTTGQHPLANEKSSFKLGKGLSLESQDGDFALVPRLRAQFLYTWKKQEGEGDEYEDATQSFMIRRARLQFAGHFWGKHNKFKAEIAISPRDLNTRRTETAAGRAPGTSPLLDWYLDFTQLRDLNLRLGQYKVPFNRQRVISSGDLQFVDRSIVNSTFNVDRDLGFDFRSKDFLGLDLFKYYVGVFVGEGRNTVHESDFGMMYLGRVEILPFGTDFKDYKESALERTSSPKLSIGLGYAYLDDAHYERGILGGPPADGGRTDIGAFNADAMFKLGGFSLFTEGVTRKGKRKAGNAEDEMGDAIPEAPALNGFGWMAQAGYLFPETRFELSARAGLVRAANKRSGLGDQNELGGAVSYYFAHHPFKLQADYFRLQSGPAKASSDMMLATHQVRVQLQAAY